MTFRTTAPPLAVTLRTLSRSAGIELLTSPAVERSANSNCFAPCGSCVSMVSSVDLIPLNITPWVTCEMLVSDLVVWLVNVYTEYIYSIELFVNIYVTHVFQRNMQCNIEDAPLCYTNVKVNALVGNLLAVDRFLI